MLAWHTCLCDAMDIFGFFFLSKDDVIECDVLALLCFHYVLIPGIL